MTKLIGRRKWHRSPRFSTVRSTSLPRVQKRSSATSTSSCIPMMNGTRITHMDRRLIVNGSTGLFGRQLIKKKAVDPAFGTGCMTITPWHDAADFDIAERHGLEKEQIIGFDGKLLPIAGEFAGQTIADARPKIVEKLQKKGLLVKTDPSYVHRKAVSQRGGGTIEPQIKLQWFIDVNRSVVPWKGKTMSLKEMMHDVVHHGDIRIIPDRFGKVYFHWIDNLRDWCISRQIWWGHRVPVWYCVGD